jgi:hypothetical protein
MAQTLQGRKRRCVRWPKKWAAKTQRADANVDRVRTLALSDRRLGVSLTAEESNMGICLEEKTRILTWQWIIHYDNASVREALRVREFLLKKFITKMDHSPYSLPAIFGSLQNKKKMPWRDKDLLAFLKSNATWQRYCVVFGKRIFKTVSGSCVIVSLSV